MDNINNTENFPDFIRDKAKSLSDRELLENIYINQTIDIYGKLRSSICESQAQSMTSYVVQKLRDLELQYIKKDLENGQNRL